MDRNACRSHAEPSFADAHHRRRRVVSWIIYVIRDRLQWKDAPKGYGPHKTLHNLLMRWSRLGAFDRILRAHRRRPTPERIMIDATHPEIHRMAASLLKKRMFSLYLGA